MRFFIALLLIAYVTMYPLNILRNTPNYGQAGKNWNGLCKAGKKQSPIYLENNILKLPKDVLNIEYTSIRGEVKWNGSFFRLDVQGNNNKVTYTDFYTQKSQEYVLKRVIIRTPSEHKINGEKFDSEIQFVNLAEDCQLKNDITIFSIFVKKVKNKAQDSFFTNFKLNGPAVVSGLNKLFSSQKAYYFYEGSQTMPDCKENVNWFIFSDPIGASSSFLTSLKQNFCENFPFGNARATQNLNGRTIFSYTKTPPK